MASHRLAELLRSTGSLSDEEVDDMSEHEAWQWLRCNASLLYHPDDDSDGADEKAPWKGNSR